MHPMGQPSCPMRFCLALLMALMLKDHGFSMIATVCSTWVFVSRSQSFGNQLVLGIGASKHKTYLLNLGWNTCLWNSGCMSYKSLAARLQCNNVWKGFVPTTTNKTRFRYLFFTMLDININITISKITHQKPTGYAKEWTKVLAATRRPQEPECGTSQRNTEYMFE